MYVPLFVLLAVFALSDARVLFLWRGSLSSACVTYDDLPFPMYNYYEPRGQIQDKNYDPNVDYTLLFNEYYLTQYLNVTLRGLDRRLFPGVSNEITLTLYTPTRLLSGYGASNSSFTDAYQFACYGLLTCGSLIEK